MKQKRYFLFILVSMILFRISAFHVSEAASPIFYSEAGNLKAAFENIPKTDAGNVVIILDISGTQEDNSERISLPLDRGLTSLTIETNVSAVTLTGIEAIFANGIPLKLGAHITLEDTALYGGGLAAAGEKVRFEQSSLVVLGNAGYLFGGGLAEDGGISSVDYPSVVQEEGSIVLYEVFGGGHAWGPGSLAECVRTSVELSGITDYALGAGFAESGGESHCEETNLTITGTGEILTGLFPGGSAAEEGSISVVTNAECVLAGRAHWIFTGDFAFSGGHTQTKQLSRLRMEDGSEADLGYLGGYAADSGSLSEVDSAELHSCGTILEVTDHGIAADGGETVTIHKGHFKCVPLP